MCKSDESENQEDFIWSCVLYLKKYNIRKCAVIYSVHSC